MLEKMDDTSDQGGNDNKWSIQIFQWFSKSDYEEEFCLFYNTLHNVILVDDRALRKKVLVPSFHPNNTEQKTRQQILMLLPSLVSDFMSLYATEREYYHQEEPQVLITTSLIRRFSSYEKNTNFKKENILCQNSQAYREIRKLLYLIFNENLLGEDQQELRYDFFKNSIKHRYFL